MTTYVYRDGARLTPYMLYQINRLDADFYKEFGVHIKVRSGIRTAEEQLKIWYERYTLTPNGRKVYDTRWWNGRLWYRISPAGTVAQPKTSNHEIQGTKAAVDLYDTGSDSGVSVAGSRRSNWLRANAARYGLVPSGFGFGEAWHYDVLNIFAAVPSGGGGTPVPKPTPTPITQEEEDMAGNSGFYYKRSTPANTIVYLIVNNDESTYHEYSNGNGGGAMPTAYNNAIAAAYRTGNFAPITEGHANVIKAQNSAKPGQETVILDWNDVEFAKFLAALEKDNAAASAAQVAAAPTVRA